MKHHRLTILILLLVYTASAQTPGQYQQQISKAFTQYNAKDYKASANSYSAAFKANGWKAETSNRYNAACSWALAGNIDSAFYNLELIAQKGEYDNYEHITVDTDLKTLYADKRWPALLARVKNNQQTAEAKLIQPLTNQLKAIYKDDQGYRQKLDVVEKQYGANSKEIKALWDTIQKKDDENLVKVTTILDKHGWLGAYEVGKTGRSALFLVIQHADIKIQDKYLPGMRLAVKNGKAEASSLALLEDRVALSHGKKQIYGSQIGRDNGGKYYVSPIEDEPNVNKRRAAVGLPPLQEYVKYWGIDYHLPKK